MGDFLAARLGLYGFFNKNLTNEERLHALYEACDDYFLEIIRAYNNTYIQKIEVDYLKIVKDPVHYLLRLLANYINNPYVRSCLGILASELNCLINFLQGQKIAIQENARDNSLVSRGKKYTKLNIKQGLNRDLEMVAGELVAIREIFKTENLDVSRRFAALNDTKIEGLTDSKKEMESELAFGLLKRRTNWGVLTGFRSILDEYADITNKILDVNPLLGDNALHIRKTLAIAPIYTCDESRKFREAMLQRNLRGKHFYANVLEGEFDEGRFGTIIYGNNGLCQVPSWEKQKELLRELKRILADDGRIILTTTDMAVLEMVSPELAKKTREFMASNGGERYKLPSSEAVKTKIGGFIEYHDPKYYENLFTEAGLDIAHDYDLKDTTGNLIFDHLDVGKAYILKKRG